MANEMFVAYSAMLGGWVVYEQVGYADYRDITKSFESKAEAEHALASLQPLTSGD